MVASTRYRCGQCYWYEVQPKNLEAGSCFLNPPDVLGVPAQSSPGVIQVKAIPLERTIGRNRPACHRFKQRESN